MNTCEQFALLTEKINKQIDRADQAEEKIDKALENVLLFKVRHLRDLTVKQLADIDEITSFITGGK